MRMRQSLAQFEAAFHEETAEERALRERLRREAAMRSRQRRQARVQRGGTVRFRPKEELPPAEKIET